MFFFFFFLKYSSISGPTNDVKVKGQMNTESVPGLVPGPYFEPTFSEIKWSLLQIHFILTAVLLTGINLI